jgi:hypothetical protein
LSVEAYLFERLQQASSCRPVSYMPSASRPQVEQALEGREASIAELTGET